LLLGGLPFSLISFNDDTDPMPGVRDGRVAVVLGGGFDTPMAGFEMDRVLLAAPVIEARGRTGGLTVSERSGVETIEALDGGFAIAEAGGFETDDEMVGLVAVEEDSGFLSAETWVLGGMRDVLRVGAGGLGGGIVAFVAADGAFFTGEAVGEGLTPRAVTLDRAGFVAPAPTT
jgi:hypothetical protein